MNPLLMGLLLLLGITGFIYSITQKYRLLKIGKSESRQDHIWQRIKSTLVFAFGQKRLLNYPLAGIAHVLFFWGFIILLIRGLTIFGQGFDQDFELPLLEYNTCLGYGYNLLKNITVILVLIGVILAGINRYILRPRRYNPSIEAGIILLIIFLMMISELMSEGSKFLLAELKGSDLLFYLDPITDTTKDIIKKLNLSQENILLVHKIGFWSHAILILIFLNIIPHTKHFHIICAIPNVFLRDLKAKGRIKPIENIEEVEVYGISQVSHLSWKQILDLYTCTECGRCSDNCPAYLTNKPLSPKECILNLRDYIFRQAKEILKTKGACSFVPNVIKPAALWSCTTCRSCEEECPVFNTHIDKIIGIRQYLVLDQSEFPSELKLPFKALETNANPWDISQQDRDNWTKGLDIKLFSKGAKSEYLYFTGCAASFDDRNKKVAQSLAKLLLKAGVDFAILGSEEQCCGDTARRTGNEYLGQILIQTNIETFTKYNIKKIITSCPHCYNTLLNEYPDFNGGYEVWHHTQFLFELINTGRLKLQKRVQSRVLYHDPCYLARYNDIYDLPRKLLKEISGIKLVEPQRSKKRALCCGAGGGRMWMEEKIEERVNELRTEEILLQSPHIITSACPYCLTMLTDGLKAKDKDEDIQMLDVVELLSESVED